MAKLNAKSLNKRQAEWVREVTKVLDAHARRRGVDLVRYAANRWVTMQSARAGLERSAKKLQAELRALRRKMAACLLAFLACASVASAHDDEHEREVVRWRTRAIHDCRIASIDLVVTRQPATGLYHLTANPRAKDGTRLTPLNCPDQENVSYQSSVPLDPSKTVLFDALGLEMLVALPVGEPVTLQLGIAQRDWSASKAPYPGSTLRVIESAQRVIIAR